MSAQGDADSPRPLLRVVRGEPTPGELAALITVLAARASTPASGGRTPVRSRWNDRSRLVRRPLAPGRGAFRAAALPR